VRLVSSLTRSGTSRGQSDSVVNAIRLCLEDVGNRVGGVEIDYLDLDDGSPERGTWVAELEIRNAKAAAADPEVMAYIGTLDADAAPHAIPILNRAGPLLMISPSNTYPGLTKPVPFAPDEPDVYYPTGVRNYCRTATTDDLQGQFAAAWVHELGHRRVWVLDDGEPYGRGVAWAFGEGCAARGISIAGRTQIWRRAMSYQPLAATIARADVDAVYYGGIIQSGAGALWAALRRAIPNTTLMAADALYERAFLETAGVFADGTLLTFGGVPPSRLPGAGAVFYHRYRERYGCEPESYAAAAYDACAVVLRAVAHVGAPDRAAVTSEVLATRDYDGLLGRWSFDANGDILLPAMSRLTVEGGDFRYLGSRPAPSGGMGNQPAISG
jgi:branched-chain amino acid transport system substrate-binding protein